MNEYSKIHHCCFNHMQSECYAQFIKGVMGYIIHNQGVKI